MIPRLHQRGTSFKGACSYVLHDPGKTSDDRIAWVLTRNLAVDPNDAWFEMFATHRDQALLKEHAGIDARGRKNTRPVLHFTLSWHADDNPSADHMKETAAAALAYLGLSEHQAVIAAHTDKQHLHVHVVANTVHPYTGRTADLKFTKIQFSRWAEAYEREHGIHCEQRIKNNDERRELAQGDEASRILMAASRAQQASHMLTAASTAEPEPKHSRPYVPVKDKSPRRREWFERKDIIDRMKSLRSDLDQRLKTERGRTWERHQAERSALDKLTEGDIATAQKSVKDLYRRRWRSLYSSQRREVWRVERIATHPFERAVFVFANRERLGTDGKPLTLRQMASLILSGDRLNKRLAALHERERRALARVEKAESKSLTEPVWQRHRARFERLKVRQEQERDAERKQQSAQRKTITFATAKEDMVQERAAILPPPRAIKVPAGPAPLPRQFHQAAQPAPLPPNAAPSRAEQIRQDMEAWRQRKQGHDFGREPSPDDTQPRGLYNSPMIGRIVNIRYLPEDSNEEWLQGEVLEDTDEFCQITLGEDLFYEFADGRVLVQKDYRVGGEVWQVHKADPDPFPSRPHAHCVGGRRSLVGTKLHLGTRQLFDGPKPIDLFLPKKPFARLIQLIRPKFPGLELPLANTKSSGVAVGQGR